MSDGAANGRDPVGKPGEPGQGSGRAPGRGAGSAAHGPGAAAAGRAHPAVRRATGSRYGGGKAVAGLGARASDRTDGPVRPGAYDPAYAGSVSDGQRNRIYSVVTALPVLMLLAGLFLFYRGEIRQSDGAPIRAEATVATGAHLGISVVRTGGRGQHFLWFDDDERGRRGVRVSEGNDRLLRPLLEVGDPLTLDIAPTVEGSTVPWVWRVRRGEEVLLDDSALLR